MTADDLLGKRYTFTETRAKQRDISIVGCDPARNRIRVHGEDGSRDWFPQFDIVRLIRAGVLVESDKPAFVLPRPPARRFTVHRFTKTG